MKKYIVSVVVIVGLAAQHLFAEDARTSEWGSVNCNAQMSIGLKGNMKEVATNQPFGLFIRIKNISSNETFHLYHRLGGDRLDPSLAFVVIAPSGKDVSPILELVARGSGASVSVTPSQTHEFEVNLSHLCKVDEVGTYTIIAKENIGTPGNQPCWVVSNPLHVSVVAGRWKPENTNAPPGF
jgi:hypothetical protein